MLNENTKTPGASEEPTLEELQFWLNCDRCITEIRDAVTNVPHALKRGWFEPRGARFQGYSEPNLRHRVEVVNHDLDVDTAIAALGINGIQASYMRYTGWKLWFGLYEGYIELSTIPENWNSLKLPWDEIMRHMPDYMCRHVDFGPVIARRNIAKLHGAYVDVEAYTSNQDLASKLAGMSGAPLKG